MTVTYLNQDQVSFEALNLKDVANSQWMIINELSAKYKRKIIKGSDSYFEDDSWVGNSIESPTIFWSSYFSLENQEALLILIKIGVYHQIEVKNNTISTMKGYINGLVNILKGVLDTKLILVGVRGQLLNGVNEITSEDLLAALDERIKKGFCIDGNTVGAINILFEIPAHVVNNLPIFLIRFKYPWKNGFENWIKSRHSDLKIPLYQKQPYQPLPSATTHKIIESSMTLIESVGNCVVDLHKILRPLDNHQRQIFFLSPECAKYLKKHPAVLKILDSKRYENSKNHHVKQGQFYRLEILLKAACINVILLTTGLRNMDLRHLVVDSCKPSGKVNILNYLDVKISKTKNRLLLPVPDQTRMAIELLESLRWNEANPYLLGNSGIGKPDNLRAYSGDTLNRWLLNFAIHFEIPFTVDPNRDGEYTAHCYRATVAGWLDSSSNLAILLIKRLFGHTNSLMPLAYLHHNPNFINARKESLEQASEIMATQMANGASQNLLSGKRGLDLTNGFENHKSYSKTKSESLSDNELFTSFQKRIKERIINGSMYAMMTPFGVICTRNPNDSSPTPCSKISDKDLLKHSAVNKELWEYMQARPNPSQCIGKSCEHAMLGPWSLAIRDSFIWFSGFLEGRNGQELNTEELRTQAKFFVEQYAEDMKKIFEMEVAGA